MKNFILISFIFIQGIIIPQQKEYFTFEQALLHPDSVEVLSLGDYRFNKNTEKTFSLDSRIKSLINLERLKFTCNYIDSLPTEISELKNLKMVTILDADNLGAPTKNCKLDFSDTFKKLSKVESLVVLYIPFIKFDLPPDVEYLTNLNTLSLVHNKLTHLPNEISRMRHLKYLDIRYNELNDLPISISNLDSLINLNLTDNEFDSIPSVVFNINNLEYLNFSYNKLKVLPREIENLKRLNQLDLKKNKISEIPNELFNCEELEILNVSDNDISNIPLSIISLKKLKKIDLSGNNLSESQVQSLKDYLKGVEIIN